MRRVTTGLVVAGIVWIATVSGRAQQSTDNVATFARLYGVVRYFYPSDAASGLDWNRFAVYGVKRVREARDVRQLETTLRELVRPLGPGIEIGKGLPPAPAQGTADGRLIAWRYLGAGMSGGGGRGPYAAKRTNRAVRASTIEGFVTVMQNVPGQDLRGRTIRLRGQVRASSRDPAGAGALWLRVDRPNQQAGFFDNMSNRPIRDPNWREYSIEGTVDGDATNVAFGVMASGAITADFDAIELALREADGRWTVLAIKDAGFEAEAGNGSGEWMRAGTSSDAGITRPADNAPEGRRFLRFSAGSASPRSDTELFETAAPAAGAHVDVDLGLGLKARVPLALSDADARGGSDSSALDALRAALEEIGNAGDPPDIDARLGDVVVAWNVFQHFYPYWEEARVDWNARLGPQLALASAAGTRSAHRDALRQLVADARDGHGSVNEPGGSGLVSMPLRFGLIENQLVVMASGVPAVTAGAVVTAIDGTPASERLPQLTQLASGTTQWKQVRALREMASCRKGAIVNLVVDDGSGPRPTSVTCDGSQPPAEKRPEPIAELTRGVWYIDLTRAPGAQVKQALSKLGSASGVVFDVRGYPTDAGAQILPHLIDAPEGDRWMHVAKIVGPFGQFDGWQSFGWDMKPASPRVAGTIVFLADERAISYAESVMGYVADRKLATIVGGTTAGTNGNVATFGVPSGFVVAFTGMRVTGHDGRTPYHLVGVRPDIQVTPTLAALRAGRDEVLERAIRLIAEPGQKQ